MKPITVISIAVVALLGVGAYAVFGVDDKPVVADSATTLDKNVNGLFGKITSQNAGSSATANAPQAPASGKMIAFEAQRDLHQFYLQAKDAKDPAMVYQAYRAYGSCQSLLANLGSLRQAMTTTEGPGVLSRERKMAIEEIVNRCKGFERMSERELQDAGNSLRESAKRLGSVEARLDEGVSEAPIDRDTMLALIRSNTNSAFERATPALSSMMKASLNVQPDTIEGQQVDFAIMLAACELGRDCSENSWQVLMQCAYDNYCQKPPSQTWQENLTEADRKHVLELKEKILTMFKTGNFSSLK